MENIRYMMVPFDLTPRQLLIYQQLYKKCSFEDMSVIYTLNQLSNDIQIVDIPVKTIYKDIQKMIKSGYLEVIRKAAKGTAPIYRIIKIQDMLENQKRTKGEPTENQNIDVSRDKVIRRRTNGEPTENQKSTLSKDIKNKEYIYKRFDSYSDNKDLVQALYDFKDMRKAIKKPLTTDRAITLLLNKLDKLSNNDNEKIEILNRSILNNWSSVYEIRAENKKLTEKKSIKEMF